MPLVRVFLLTYRRPHLLRRALDSLRAQICTDWICELHNDDPTDRGPAELVRALGDPRVQLRNHERNLGAVATFDIAHGGAPEPFFSILEDDNWWEPGFLDRMLAVLAARPEAEMAWANMRLWRESAEDWTDTGETIWPVVATPHVSIGWPQLLQFDSPLHSNGAMLVRRAAAGPRLQTGAAVTFEEAENVRERGFYYPLVLVPEPLANFALTARTARSHGRGTWAAGQALLGAAFLKHVPLSSAEQAALWAARRSATPPATSGLFFAARLQPTRGFLNHATLRDRLRFFRGCLRRPLVALATLRARQRHPELWLRIDHATAGACARQQSPADIPPKRFARRSDLAN